MTSRKGASSVGKPIISLVLLITLCIVSVSAAFYVNSITLNFDFNTDASEELSPVNRPLSFIQNDGSVQELFAKEGTCPARTDINGHKDIRVQNVVLKKVNAPENNPSLLTKNLKGIVDWYVYGGCGDNTLHLRASEGTSYSASNALSLFDQTTDAEGNDCKSIAHSELPVPILEEVVQEFDIDTTEDAWVTIAAYGVDSGAEDNDAVYGSCIYTSCDYDADGITSVECGGTDQDDYTDTSDDTTPPAPITNLHEIGFAPNLIVWAWNNPSDADFSHAMLFLNGVFIANTSAENYTVTGLTGATTYTLSVKTVDAAGNINQNAVSDSATTSGGSSGDTTAPTISNIQTDPAMPFTILNTTQQDLDITFQSSEYPITVTFRIYDSAGTIRDTFAGISITGPSSFPITYELPILPVGTYTIKMTATDPSGNSRIVTIGSFTVIGQDTSDTTPPAPITNLTLTTATNNSLTWAWNNPSDPDFAAAIIYLDGINVLNTTQTTFSATNLAPNTIHTITITTMDINGNINTQAVSNTAATLPGTVPEDDDDDDNGGGNGGSRKDRDTQFNNENPFETTTIQGISEGPLILENTQKTNVSSLKIIVLLGLMFLVLLLILLIALILLTRETDE